MANITINSLPTASTIDATNDLLPIYTNSLTATQAISRNTYLNLSSQPVGLTDSQTLTNKTLTSPTINGATLSGTLAGTYTIGGTPTFPSSVTQNTVVQTLTNKTLTSPTINSPTITNATISADTLTGYTTSNSGTIYGVPVTTGAINASYLTASSITNTQIASAGLYTTKVYNPYKFSVYRNAAWTSGNGTFANVIFDTKVFDTGNNYSTSTGNFTAPVNGFYQINVSLRYLVGNGALYSMAINVTSSIANQGGQFYVAVSNTANQNAASASKIVQLNAGNTISIGAYGNGGAGNTGVDTSFSGFLVSAT